MLVRSVNDMTRNEKDIKMNFPRCDDGDCIQQCLEIIEIRLLEERSMMDLRLETKMELFMRHVELEMQQYIKTWKCKDINNNLKILERSSEVEREQMRREYGIREEKRKMENEKSDNDGECSTGTKAEMLMGNMEKERETQDKSVEVKRVKEEIERREGERTLREQERKQIEKELDEEEKLFEEKLSELREQKEKGRVLQQKGWGMESRSHEETRKKEREKERQGEIEEEKERQRETEREKERQREEELRVQKRQRKMKRQREKESQREIEEEKERQREIEEEKERQREEEIRVQKGQRKMKRQREKERRREIEEEKERQREIEEEERQREEEIRVQKGQRKMKRQREKERQREIEEEKERQREIEEEKERQREIEEEKERQREEEIRVQKGQRKMKRQREKERQREIEEEKERQREIEEERERQREEEIRVQKMQRRVRQREKERQREIEEEKERQRETEKEIRVQKRQRKMEEKLRDNGEKGNKERQREEAIPGKCPKKALFKSTYEKGALLGEGGYGSVYAGTRKRDGLPVAIKYVSKSSAGEYIQMPGQEGPLPLEVALMKQVNADPPCPYITQLLDWFDYPTRYVLVLERPVPCQDLINYCKDLGGCMSESLAQRVLRQLLLAIQHCHERGVLHRDIKPENILIRMDTLDIKLLDFGCGDLLRETAYTSIAGTPKYLPPEWFQQKLYLAGPATVWSLGVTLINLVCGYLPFLTAEDTIRGLQHLNKWVSPELCDLIYFCLSPRSADRPTLEEIQFHSWLHQY